MSSVDRQGGEARNHETEVEAVCEALSWADTPDPGGRLKPSNYTGLAAAAIAALDAVRSPQGEDHEAPAYGPRGRWTQLRTERDAYKAALERIAALSMPYRDTANLARHLAREVLAGDHNQGAHDPA